MDVEGNNPWVFPCKNLRQAGVERAGPFVGVVGQAENLGGFLVYADDNGALRSLNRPPEFEKKAEARVLLDSKGDAKGAHGKSRGPHEQTQ